MRSDSSSTSHSDSSPGRSTDDTTERLTGSVDTVIFDVDGTLVDSNYQHALAWFRAFRRFELTVPIWQIHRAIGMGGDQLVGHLAGDEVEDAHGDALREAWQEEIAPMVAEIQPLDGARDLLQAVRDSGMTLVLASSGEKEQVETFLDLVGGKELADAWTSSEDAEESKPAPDLLEVALAKVEGSRAVMVGDSVWDVEAAKRAGMPAVSIMTGGFSEAELRDAGAVEVYASLGELHQAISEGAFDRLDQRG
ncbi:MAG: HAD-superfamily hydrolase, subfamily variant 1 [Humibacillus sp.]|nr:HAD-superfamily hydrolase, subfamily variant 1 [Humibacillus sp.]